MSNLQIKDFDKMVSDTLQAIVDSGVGITNITAGSVVRTLTEVILDNVDATNYYINYVHNAISIDNATGDDLDRLILILGIVRRPPVPATGIVTFSTGDAPYEYDIPIPYGFEVNTRQASDGTIHTYTVNQDDVILPAGQTSIDVEVKANESGHIYLPAGALCVMGKSIVGIATVTNQNEINSGDDKESDEDLRERAKNYILSFGKCTDNALKIAVEGVDGIINCTIIDQYDGVGTTGALIVPEILPVTDDVANAVSAVVAETKAAGVKVFIIYPTIQQLDISINITDTVDSTLVLEAISNYVNSLRVGQTFVVRQMERKILNAIDKNNSENDEIDITTVSPAGNVECDEESIVRVNSVTVNGVRYDV